MNKKSFLLGFLALSLWAELLAIAISPIAKAAQESEASSTKPGQIVYQENFTPPGDGEPKDTTGASSRDGLKCSKDEQPIKPLMPRRNYGLTLAERPSIFIYLPKTSARQVVLSFRDETGKDYQRAFLPISSDAGIVSFTLPNDKPALAVGKNYQWSLVVVCGAAVQPDDPVFRGWVQRVALDAKSQQELGQKSPVEQAEWYGAKGYWYDTIAALATARLKQANDPKVTALWQSLLESVGLSAIASEPLSLKN